MKKTTVRKSVRVRPATATKPQLTTVRKSVRKSY